MLNTIYTKKQKINFPLKLSNVGEFWNGSLNLIISWKKKNERYFFLRILTVTLAVVSRKHVNQIECTERTFSTIQINREIYNYSDTYDTIKLISMWCPSISINAKQNLYSMFISVSYFFGKRWSLLSLQLFSPALRVKYFMKQFNITDDTELKWDI